MKEKETETNLKRIREIQTQQKIRGHAAQTGLNRGGSSDCV